MYLIYHNNNKQQNTSTYSCSWPKPAAGTSCTARITSATSNAEMAGKEVLAVIEGVSCARRWVWMEDWRSWQPFFFPLSFRGDFPWFPDVLSAKKTLLAEVSTLCAEFGDDTGKLVIKGVHRDKFEDSFKLNEDPECNRLLADDWAINESWALHVAVLWPVSSMSCNQTTTYNTKQQIAIEKCDYADTRESDEQRRAEQKKAFDEQRWYADNKGRLSQQQQTTTADSSGSKDGGGGQWVDHEQQPNESSRESDKSYEAVQAGQDGKWVDHDKKDVQ